MSSGDTAGNAAAPPRRRRSGGERSRQAILGAAASLATVEGLNGLTIGRLADAVGMSKSGLFAHFGSKEELQLATVEFAEEVFAADVIAPVAPDAPGIERLRALTENFLGHVRSGVFPGGCFFAAATAELDAQPGPVRDRVLEVENDFIDRLEDAVRDAQAQGAIDPSEDAAQLVFELQGSMLLGNVLFVVAGEETPLQRARRAIERRLSAAAAL